MPTRAKSIALFRGVQFTPRIPRLAVQARYGEILASQNAGLLVPPFHRSTVQAIAFERASYRREHRPRTRRPSGHDRGRSARAVSTERAADVYVGRPTV